MAPPLPPKFHPNAPKSFAELMAGVDRGHAALRAIPGAQAISPAFRQMQKNMLPGEILDKYSDMGLFGKTPRGEPVRATLVPSRGRDISDVKSGKLPSEGRIRLDPESRVPRDLIEAAQLPDRHAGRGEYPRIGWEEDTGIGSGNEMLSPLQDAMRRARRDPNSNPSMLDINAMSVKPYIGTPDPDIHWWSQGPSRGRALYGALYDMIRAGGHGNAARTLTGINTVRRLGNVASHSAGHGDLGFIGPVSEYPSQMAGPGKPSFSPQLFNQPFTNRPGEETWMRTTMGPDIAAQALGLNPKDLLGMTPEQIRGLLYTREANLAAASGPKSGSRVSPLRLGDPNVSMYDKAALADVAQNARTYSQDELADAFGPHTLGRQLTTEELMLRMMRRGETPEEIVEDILLRGKDEGFNVEDALRGRYMKGGRVKKVAPAVSTAPMSFAELVGKTTKPTSLSDDALAKALNIDAVDVPRVLPQKQRAKNLSKFVEPSVVKQRVYHGTPYGESIVEDKQFAHYGPDSSEIHWFSGNPKQADEYTEKYMGDDDDPAAIFPAYLQLRNPLAVPFNMNDRITPDFWKYAEDLGFNKYDFDDWRKENDRAPTRKVWQVVNSPQFKNAIERKGYDGISVREGEHDTWGVLDAARIKSQFNEGTYDTTNPDMGKKKGGLVAALQG